MPPENTNPARPVLLGLGAIVVAAIIWIGGRTDTTGWGVRERQVLEDGWTLVIRVKPQGWFPMPGFARQSGDRPGRVELFAPDGRSCGDAPVEMAGFVTIDRGPGEISIQRPRAAVWDLAACAVRFHDLYRD